jgi:hypothetical protein
LQLSAIDPENGLFQMRFSRDKQTWSAFEPYATTKQWELEPETGPKDFYVKFSDYAANESEVYHSSITYLRPLKITDITPADGASFYESDIVSISPTLNTTDTSSLEYQFSIDGVIRQAWSTLSSYSWTPTSQDKGSHNIKVEVRDISGQDTRDVEVYIFRKPLSPP